MSAAMKEPADENMPALAQRVAELEALLAKATAFDLGGGLTIALCPVSPGHWVVYRDEWLILDKEGSWTHAPARRHHWTAEFLASTRFTSLAEAVAAAEKTRRN